MLLRIARFAAFLLPLAALSCQPGIGDSCKLSTDCSSRGDRLCDLAQPDGYCTMFNCDAKLNCPSDSVCVLFGASLPGCPYDDRHSPSRTGRSMCLRTCQGLNGCRRGYSCESPIEFPYDARIFSKDQDVKVCLVATSGLSAVDAAPSPVCDPLGPDVPPIDASQPNVDAGVDAADDATTDASDDSSIDDASADVDAQ